MKNLRILSILLVLFSVLNLVYAECPDYTQNPYYNHIETDEDGVEWVEGNSRPRTA